MLTEKIAFKPKIEGNSLLHLIKADNPVFAGGNSPSYVQFKECRS